MAGSLPLIGAAVTIYAAGTIGNGSAPTALLSAPLITNASGASFTLNEVTTVATAYAKASLFTNTGRAVFASGIGGNNLEESFGGAVDVNDVAWIANEHSSGSVNGGGGSMTLLNDAGGAGRMMRREEFIFRSRWRSIRVALRGMRAVGTRRCRCWTLAERRCRGRPDMVRRA